MADIQPKNTNTVRVDAIDEKTPAAGISLKKTTKVDTINEYTASNGVHINGIIKATTAVIPKSATIDLGTSTAAEHYREAFLKEVTSNGQDITAGTDSAHSVQFKSNALNRVNIDSSGNLNQDATNGGNLVWTKASSAVAQAFGSAISAAGTVITDATDLTAVFNNVTTVAASTGVQLWDAPQGAMIIIRNAGANALNVFPHSGTGTINGGAGGAAVSVATSSLSIFWRVSSTNWIGIEIANGGTAA